jgi:hypothetical protein
MIDPFQINGYLVGRGVGRAISSTSVEPSLVIVFTSRERRIHPEHRC